MYFLLGFAISCTLVNSTPAPETGEPRSSPTVAATTPGAPIDYCAEVCRMYSVANNPAVGFDLCGPSGSACVSNLCTNLYWADLEDGSNGRGLLNSEMESDLTPEEMSDPLTCVSARQLVGAPPAIRGIRDTENTCYLNTALQLLFHTPAVGRFLSSSLPSVIPQSNRFMNNFLALRDGVASGNATLDLTSLPIRDEMHALGFEGFDRGVLGDASEAITALINQIDTSVSQINSTMAAEDTLLSRFAINSQVTRNCPVCRSHVERTDPPQLMLQIPLASDLASATLNHLLTPILRQEETISMRCSSCNDEQRAVNMRTNIVPTGDVFMILIGRTAIDGARINSAITYPSILEHESLSSRYQLVGSAHHNGRDANNGHYYAEVSREGFWFRVDDLRITPMTTPGSTSTSTSVTMLIYERM